MKKIVIILITFTTLLSSCEKEQTINSSNLNDFTWKAMNAWYNWQANVPALADGNQNNQGNYNNYLNGFSTPNALFESLLYRKGTVDRFSWFINDYVEQQRKFQGVSTTFGFRPKLVKVENTNNIILYIQHVSKNSPADKAGFKRGDIINGINGETMNVNNYKSVLQGYYAQTAEFSFVNKDGTTLKEKKTITRSVVADNPVYLSKIFENIGGKKVGYLVYNGFRSSYNDELNAEFAKFKAEKIQELILDFRINGGGSVKTCGYLASMIHEEAKTSIFAELRFNNKRSKQNDIYNFSNNLEIFDTNNTVSGTQTINRLSNLSKIYVLTSNNTASASEMIINGLRPFITVKTVGTTTYGKNVGSITLYDSPNSLYTNPNTANTSHKKALQPIVFQIYNKNGKSDYVQGFKPTIKVEEHKFWNAILPFGDKNEVLLKAALDDIRGTSSPSARFPVTNTAEQIDFEFGEHKFEKEMYIDANSIEIE